MRKKTMLALAFGAFVVAALPAAAHEEAAKSNGLRDAALARFKDTSGKIVALAEAIPANKYAWRPAEGIRSVSEVLMHVVGPNYFLLKGLGANMPEGMGRDLEKETDRAKILDALKKSIAEAERVIGSLDESQLNKNYPLFGREMSGYSVLLIALGHCEEHLGQLIAYARSNGVKPPWS